MENRNDIYNDIKSLVKRYDERVDKLNNAEENIQKCKKESNLKACICCDEYTTCALRKSKDDADHNINEHLISMGMLLYNNKETFQQCLFSLNEDKSDYHSIKTFEDACKIIDTGGFNDRTCFDKMYSHELDGGFGTYAMLAFLKLRIICKALNTFVNSNEQYIAGITFGRGACYGYNDFDIPENKYNTDYDFMWYVKPYKIDQIQIPVPYELGLNSIELVDYCICTFPDLWMDLLLPRKEE